MIEWNQKHTLVVILSLLLAGLVFYLSYLFVIQPKELQISSLKDQIEAENKIISSLQTDFPESIEDIKLSASELQKILPVSPFEEQFLLELEKAETISNSLITAITFQEGTLAEIVEDDSAEEDIVSDTEIESEESSSSEAELVEAPSGLQKLTAELTVESPSYYELEDFLSLLENGERITQIEAVQVSGQPELVKLIEDVEENYQYKVVVSAFYLPNLDVLRDQLPPFSKPAGSEKNNPFVDLK